MCKAFHLFKYEDALFAYHYALGRFVNLSKSAYAVLERRQKMEELPSDMELPVELEREIGLLEQTGFFSPVEITALPDEKFEQLLSARYNAPWNKLELAISESCNLACRYCYCETCRGVISSCGLMTEEVARQAINWLFAVSGKCDRISITFFGGEPLLNKPVLKFSVAYSQRLAALHGKSVFYSMTTNGTLLDDEIIAIIKRYNFGLMVSLDGPREIHDAQCPTCEGSNSYDMVVAGIRKLMARRRMVTVRCTMAHPAPDIMRLIKFFDEFGFTRIVLGRVFNPAYSSSCDFTKEDFHAHERQMVEEVIPWIINEMQNGRRPKYNPFAAILERQHCVEKCHEITPFKCGACRGTTTVGADGTLYPCHRFVGMEKWRIGRVDVGPDYGKCKKFWRDYFDCVKRNCIDCWAYPICKGPCPWEIAKSDGSFCFNEFVCENTLSWIKMRAFFERRYGEETARGKGCK